MVGAVASGINAVAGGGSLLSFPTLTIGLRMPTTLANATNSISLWPGSLGSVFGFANLLPKTKHYLSGLLAPTVLGSAAGAWLFVSTSQGVFDLVVPFLILVAAILLMLQPRIKAWALQGRRTVSKPVGMLLQFLVAVYGGYFGAGMGIMMLAVFALYMEGNIHEINAVKAWLGLIINFVCSAIFVAKGMIDWPAAAFLTVGSLVGGFYAARLSQRIDPDRLRLAISVYGLATAGYYLLRAFHLGI